MSASAAAAALRSLTSSPVPVGDIQTKRMARRGSTSSFGSGSGSVRPAFGGDMQRRGSVGSMSQRSFRSPSPGATPPVPTIPSQLPPMPSRPPVPDRSHRRPPSQDSTFRNSSAHPPEDDGIGFAGDRVRSMLAAQKQRQALMANNRISIPAQDPRMRAASPDSPRSVNFSRPMSPAMNQRSPAPYRAVSPPARLSNGVRARPASALGTYTTGNSQPVQPQRAVKAIDPPRQAAQPNNITPRPINNNVGPNSARPSPAQRTLSLTSVPSPTADQIRAFQSRANAGNARRIDPPSPTTNGSMTAGLATPQAKPVVKSVATTKALSRNQSPSPARSAHFSASPLLEVTKHQPPPRSMSPVKSAMRSGSRSNTPDILHSRINSDMSDAGSDVGGSGSKRKSTRVSFEERPIMVGSSVDTSGPGNTLMSPQYKKSLAKAGNETKMEPMPSLPSFGSIRRKEGVEEKANTTQNGPVAMKASSSSPISLPSGDGDIHQGRADISRIAARSMAPTIAIQPATPGLDEASKQLGSDLDTSDHAQTATDLANFVHPTTNGFVAPTGLHTSTIEAQEEPDEESDEAVETYSDAAEDQSELDDAGGFASLDAILESPATETAPALPVIVVAPETIPETFAESGEHDVPGQAITTSEESEQGVAGQEDWDLVREYWSSLSENKKREIEYQAHPDANGAAVVSDKAIDDKSTKHVSKNSNGEAGHAPYPPWPDQQYQRSVQKQQPKKSAMKQTARTAPVVTQPSKPRDPKDATHMRKSMRSSDTMQTSMRAGGRPSSLQATSMEQQSNSQRPTSIDPAVLILAQKMMESQPARKTPGLSRTLSNDSNASDSSFKRGPGSVAGSVANSEGGRYSMKRGMRDGQAPRSRPLSPTASMATKRVSMRDSTNSTGSTMRSGKRDVKEAGGFLGLGGKQKQKQKPGNPQRTKATPRFASRFADSSDEEDEGFRPHYRSRFFDSDDESEDESSRPVARNLRPVRGIPKKANQLDNHSTDLSEEEEEDHPIIATAAQTTPTKQQNGVVPAAISSTTAIDTAEGQALSAGTLRSQAEKSSKRGSIFGRKKKDLSDINATTSPPRSPITKIQGTPSSPPSRPASLLMKNSRPRDAAHIRQSPSRSLFRRRLSMSSNVTDADLDYQKDDFPYPPPPIPDQYKDEAGANRPITSDGVNLARPIRPGMGNKRNSSMTAPVGPGRVVSYSGRTGKKKKFQGLRRVFGLHD